MLLVADWGCFGVGVRTCDLRISRSARSKSNSLPAMMKLTTKEACCWVRSCDLRHLGRPASSPASGILNFEIFVCILFLNLSLLSVLSIETTVHLDKVFSVLYLFRCWRPQTSGDLVFMSGLETEI